MKREHKIGIAITCTFLCLAGSVIGLKMQEKSNDEPTEKQLAQASQDPTPIKESSEGNLLGLGEAAGKFAQPEAGGTLKNSMQPDKEPPPLKPEPGADAQQKKSGSPPSPLPMSPGMPGLGGDPSPLPAPSALKPEPPSAGGFSPNTPKDDPEKEKKAKEGDLKKTPPPPTAIGLYPTATSSDGKSAGQTNKKTYLDPKVVPVGSNGPGGFDSEETSEKGKSLPPTAAAEKKEKEKKGVPPSLDNQGSLGGPSAAAKEKPPSTGAAAVSAGSLTNQAGEKKPAAPPVAPFMPGMPATATPPPVAPPAPSAMTPPPPSGFPPLAPPASGAPPAPSKPGETAAAKSDGDAKTPPPPLIPGMSAIKPGDIKPEKKEPLRVAPLSSAPPPVPPVVEPDPSSSALPPISSPTAKPSAPPEPPSAVPTNPTPAAKPLPPSGSVFQADPQASAAPSGRGAPVVAPLTPAAAPLAMPALPKAPVASSAATDAGHLQPVPSVSAPVSSKPMASAPPQVVVFDEQEYVCQKSDTFEEISKRFYRGNGKYAAALLRHNQNHARASDAMMRDGTLTPGERIFIPPADILEQRYPDVIARPAAPAPGAVPASFTTLSNTPALLPPIPAQGSSNLKPVPPFPASASPSTPPSAPLGSFAPSPNR